MPGDLDKIKRRLSGLKFESSIVEPLSTCRIDEWPDPLKISLSTRPNFFNVEHCPFPQGSLVERHVTLPCVCAETPVGSLLNLHIEISLLTTT